VAAAQEGSVSDATFLNQLEHRSRYIKDTIAALDAERQRIEATIRQLHTLASHYDALLAAERVLAEMEIAPRVAETPDTATDAGDPDSVPAHLLKQPDAPRPPTPRLQVGDIVCTPDGTRVVVTDVSDPALLSVEHPSGKQMRIGRRAVILPEEARPPRPPRNAVGAQPAAPACGDQCRVRAYPTPSNSTSKTSSAFGGMAPPAPRAP
jgi:hypothetical protein